jgi:hypothetical protein
LFREISALFLLLVEPKIEKQLGEGLYIPLQLLIAMLAEWTSFQVFDSSSRCSEGFFMINRDNRLLAFPYGMHQYQRKIQNPASNDASTRFPCGSEWMFVVP